MHHKLSDVHKQQLAESAIHTDVIEARGYYSAPSKSHLGELGFKLYQRRMPSLVIPLYNKYGEIAMATLRPDMPRTKKDGKPTKYEFPDGARMQIDVPPVAWNQEAMGDPTVPLWITEGVKKGDSLVSKGVAAISFPGVWNWRGTNENGGKTVIATFETIAFNGREVFIAFDSDANTNRHVRLAMARLGSYIESRQGRVRYTRLPPGKGGKKMGVDDYFADGRSLDALKMTAGMELPPMPAEWEDEQDHDQPDPTKGQNVLVQEIAEEIKDQMMFNESTGEWFFYGKHRPGIWSPGLKGEAGRLLFPILDRKKGKWSASFLNKCPAWA